MSENSTVDVSVVIPIHGNPIYLNETLESLEFQSFENFEVIAVLDRADAWVDKLLNSTKIKNREIKVLISNFPGISAALELGILESRGQMIARIDSDDTMESERLAIQFNYLVKHSDISIVGTQINYINSQGLRIGMSNYPESRSTIRAILPIRNCIAHPSVMMRRNIFEDIQGYRSEFNGAEDYELWLRAANKFGIVNISQKLTNYRLWENQLTNQYNRSDRELLHRIRREHFTANGILEGSLKYRRWMAAARYMDLAMRIDRGAQILKRVFYAFASFTLSPIRISFLFFDIFFISNKL